MPLDMFTEEAWKGLVAGDEEVVVGPAKKWYGAIEPARQKYFRMMIEMMKGMGMKK